ncbi:hypothetical protein MNAN1_000550 [Malassezia nana]|uniref:Uncharacterized protein n=1 Tax=Malassezia nana TaxID=180528 RepID=A0AAF0EFQ6_9BASI|nr:hypothetical protein MNAN1_000550 [Malassezia nana]
MGEQVKQERQGRLRGRTISGGEEERWKERSGWNSFGLPRILPWARSEGYDFERASNHTQSSSAGENDVQLGPLSEAYPQSVSSPSDLGTSSPSRTEPRNESSSGAKGSRVVLLSHHKERTDVPPPPIVVDQAGDESQDLSCVAGPSRETQGMMESNDMGAQSSGENDAHQKESTMARLGHMIPLHRLSSLWPSSFSNDGNNMSRSSSRAAEELAWEQEGKKPTVRIESEQDGARNESQFTPQLHSDAMVDYLDVLDSAVSVFNTLQDYGNSAMLPNLPWLYNRRPMLRMEQLYGDDEDYPLSPVSPENQSPPNGLAQPTIQEPKVPPGALTLPFGDEEPRQPSPMNSVLRMDTDETPKSSQESMEVHEHEDQTEQLQPSQKNTDDPHTERWYQMDEDERKELEGHIRYLLTNKSKTKRMARGFWNFVRTPMGFILTLYIFLIFSWGVVIFLFIVHWVDVQPYRKWRIWVEICDQVLCALFVIRGVGFAPFRAVDTYRMAHIAHFHFLTYKRRKLLHLPELQNRNELPRYSKERLYKVSGHHRMPPPEDEGPKELVDPSKDLEAIGVRNTSQIRSQGYHLDDLLQPIPGQPCAHPLSREEIQWQRLERVPSIKSMVEKDSSEVSVLTPSEQALLQHHQRKFHASHTFYRHSLFG